MSTRTDCPHCIDGMAPSATPLLGDCVRVCPACQPQCVCCLGAGRFPFWTRDMAAFIATLNANGLIPALCHTCGGVVDISRMHERERPS